MTTPLNEDDLYRTSTQYKLWSFSPEQLSARRRETHQLALARLEQYQNATTTSNGENATSEYLTEEEELSLIKRYCSVLHLMADRLKFANTVTATAVQYLKRFYLSNSCMTYPPKEIYKTVLFLASKTEAIHWSVGRFAQGFNGDPEAILAPEYKVMQALRFTLDVRHPYRGLKGVLMELLNMVEGMEGSVMDGKSGAKVKEAMRGLAAPTAGECRTPWKPPKNGEITDAMVKDRVMAAYDTARHLLDAPAWITDVYFLYTPSQILLAALQLADPQLAGFYLDTKLPLTLPSRAKILATLTSCAALLGSYDEKGGMTKQESVELEAKLERCRDPTTQDLIKSHNDKKSGARSDGQAEEKAMKRKLEKEKNSREMDDLFGPSLGKG